MVQQVKAEDGTLHEFPDEATPDQMMAAISSSKPAAPAEKPGIMARIGAGAAGLVSGAAELVGLGAPVEVAEMAAGRQPAPHFGAPGPFGATAEQAREVEKMMHGVTPATVAKGVAQGIVQPFKTMGNAIVNPPQTLGQAYDVGKAVPQAAATLQMGYGAAKAAGGAIARVPAVARTAERMAAAGEAKVAGLNEAAAAKNELISEAKRLKFKLTPQQVDSGVVGKVAASVANRAQLEREFSLNNAESVRAATAADVGIKGQLTSTSVAEKIQETLPAYLTPRTFGKMNLAEDSVWQSKLEEIRGISKQAEIDFPDDVAPAIQEEIKKFDRRIVDANSVVEKVASLRERSSDNFAANNSGARALARVQRKLADEMENALERHGEKIGQKGAVQTFKNARRQLAKLYTIRDSMTPAGDVDLGELVTRYHANEKLDGNLLTMAKLKIEFDRSFQPPNSVRSSVVGGADVVLGAGALAATGQIGPAAIVAARPATRMVLGSPLYQKYVIGPKIAKPSLAARAARKVADVGKQGQTLESVVKKPKPPKQQTSAPGPIGRQRGSFSLAEAYKKETQNTPETALKTQIQISPETKKAIDAVYGPNNPLLEKIAADVEISTGKKYQQLSPGNEKLSFFDKIESHPEYAKAAIEQRFEALKSMKKTGVANLYKALAESGNNVSVFHSKSIGSNSSYLTVKNPKNGKTVKIRLSDHEPAEQYGGYNANDVYATPRQWKSALRSAQKILNSGDKQ